MILEWPIWAQIILGYLIVQRLGELVYASANTRRLLAEGGREHGARHYPFFILLHGGWIAAIIICAEPTFYPPLIWIGLFVLSQILRFWTLASIGRWWTTRIISAPHFPRVRQGPYRFLPHPNYTVVAMEIAVIPLLLGTPWVALIFTIANAVLLRHRISLESEILKEREGQ